MIQHHRYTQGRALRFLLGRLRGGPLDELESTNILIKEVAGCSYCWFVIADNLADMLKREVPAQHRERCVHYLELRLLEQLDDHDDDDDLDVA